MQTTPKLYRAQKRNAYVLKTDTKPRGFVGWMAWLQANVTAKLALRREQCNRARQAVGKALAADGVLFTGLRAAEIVRKTLLKFWQGEQPRTRVIHRIVRGLDTAQAAV